jgi:predicted PurR-regulated permease PerM
MMLSVEHQVKYWGVGLLALILVLWALSDVLLPYLAGAALAYFMDPVADRLEARGLSRTLATAIITISAIGVGLILLLILIPATLDQIRLFLTTLPQLTEAVRSFVEANFPDQLKEGSSLASTLTSLRDSAREWSLTLLKTAWSGGLAVVDFLMLLVITPVVSFYLLMDWDRMIARIDGWLPLDHAPAIRRIARDIDKVLAGFVRGQLTVCVILGGFYAVALGLIGLKFGLAIGLFAGLISFIPFVGSIFGGVLSIGVAMFQFWDNPVWILVVAGVFAFGQMVEGNFLTPKLVGGSVGLHPVALMFALSAFGLLFGFTGLLIAVPTSAAIGVLGRFALEQYQSGRLYRGLSGPAEGGDAEE